MTGSIAAGLVGSAAPDFTLPDQFGEPFRVTDLRGDASLIVFFPFAFTPVCTGELRELQESRDWFAQARVRVVAISCDAPFTQRAFAEARGYDLPLLSDFWPHGAASSAYGVFDTVVGRPERGSFLLDADGIVRWCLVTPPGEARPMTAYREAIAAL